MSRVVDERVVSMQFDNKQFENNVATSMGTLEKLKRSLNLSGASKGLENVTAAARKCDLTPIGRSAETVGLKFNAMYTIADQSLRNITTRVQQTAERIVKAFTIEPIKTGFQEYETQINAVQTILANTESKGTTLDDVNAALDELNTYADKTIYNFTEMTRNIGTFTAAGVDLDKSVTSIKGIANLAAVSGSTSQQASTAMYQLSQALAAGTVKLMDWNSVVNAGMGGELFQNALKRTATQMGYNVDAMIEKYGSFRESLTQGEWLTAEVLTETLTQLSGAYTEADLIAQGYSESQAAEITKLADTAVNAATKVKTFTQLMDTLKEAAQSGWTQTWELIVGDFEKAKSLWTGVSDTFGEIINSMSESRNTVLAGALNSNFDNFIKKMNEAGLSTTEFEETLSEVLKNHGYDVDAMIEKYGSFEAALKAGAYPVANLKEAIERLSISMVDLSKVEAGLAKGDRGEQVKKVQEVLDNLGFDLGKWGVDGIIGSQTEAAIKAFQELEGLEVTGIIDEKTLEALEKAQSSMGDLKKELMGLVDGVDELGGRERLIQSFKNIWEALTKPIKAVGEAWNKVFGSKEDRLEKRSQALLKFIKGFESFTEKLIISGDSAEKITSIFSGLFSVIKIGAGFVGGGFKMAFSVLSSVLANFDLNILDVLASIGDFFTKAHKWIEENNIIGDSIAFVAGMIMLGVGKIQEWCNAFLAIPGVQEKITAIRDAFAGIGDYIGGGVKEIQEFWDNLKGPNWKLLFDGGELGKTFRTSLIDNFKTNVLGYFSNIGDKISEFAAKIIAPLSTLKDSAGEYLSATGDKFITFKDKLVDFFSGIRNWIGDNKGAIAAFGSLLSLIFVLSKIGKGVSKIAGFFDSFSGIGESISTFFDSFTVRNKAKAQAEKLEAVSDLVKSMAILAGAVAVLAVIPSEKLWTAVKVMGVLAGGVLTMVLLLKLINKIPSEGETDLVQFGKLMAKLGWAMLLMTASIKILGGMDGNELTQGMWAVTAFMGMVMILMASTKLIDSKDMSEFAKMIRKLSTTLLILSGVVYILGKMDTKTLVQGGLAVGAFLLTMVGVMKMTKNINKDSNAFGKMIRNLSMSLILLSAAVYILGSMDTKTLIQGGLAIVAFLGIMLGAMKLTKSMSKDIASFSKMMFGLSAALIMMSLAVKILGSMDTATLVKGGIAISAFVGIVALLAKTTDLLGKYSFNAGKMGLMLLGFAGAVLIITGAVLALSLLDGGKLKQAMIAVTGIGIIFAGILAVTKFAKSIKTGTLIGVGIAIGIMAASVVALSFVDEKDLRNATIALTTIIGICSLLAYSMKNVSMKSALSLAGMVLIIGGIAAAIVALSKHVQNSDKALKVALAMSAIITALSASVLLLSKVSKLDKSAYTTIGILMVILAAVAAITIWQLPNIAKQLSAFATELEPFITTMSQLKVNKAGMDALKSLGDAMWSFTKAGAIYTVFSKFGSMSGAFDEFGRFIKDVVPTVKDLAMEVSGSGVEINRENLNAVLGAITTLAEASNKAASIDVVIGGGGGKGFGGGFLGISVPQMSAFTEWIREIIPSMKDLALALSDSDININEKALTSICEGVATLAEAAGNAPSTDVAVGFAKFTGGFGGGVAISIPNVKSFTSYIRSSVTALRLFINGVDFKELGSIDTKKIEPIMSGISTIITAISELGKAADNAPKTVYAGGLGGAISKITKTLGVGVGGYRSTTDLAEFKDYLMGKDGAIAAVNTFMTALLPVADQLNKYDSATITAITGGVSSIITAISALASAASNAPTDINANFAGGFGGFINGIVGGGGKGEVITKTDLDEFRRWLIGSDGKSGMLSALTGFIDIFKDGDTLDAIKKISNNTEGIDAVISAVNTLAGLANSAPKKIDAKVGLGGIFGKLFGGIGVGGGYGEYHSVTELKDFTKWITEVTPVLKNFVVDVSGVTIPEGSAIEIVLSAIDTIATAANSVQPKTDVWAAGLAVISGFPVIAAGAGGSEADYEGFIEFMNALGGSDGPLSKIISAVNGLTFDGSVDSDASQKLQRLLDAVDSLAGSSTNIPEYTTIAGGLGVIGGYKTTGTDFSGFSAWITEMTGEDGKGGIVKLISDANTNLPGEGELDVAKITNLCYVVEELAKAAAVIPDTSMWGEIFSGVTNFDGFKTFVSTIGTEVATFAETIANSTVEDIDLGKVLSLANVLKTLAEVGNLLSTGGYVDVSIFGLKDENEKSPIDYIVDAVVSAKEALGKLEESDLAALETAANAINAFSMTLTTVAGNYASLAQYTPENNDQFKTFVTDLATTLSEFATAMSEGVNLNSLNIASTAADLIATAVTKLSAIEYGKLNIGLLKTKLEELATALTTFATDMGDSSEVCSKVVTIANDIITAFTTTISDSGTNITDVGSGMVTALISGISSENCKLSIATAANTLASACSTAAGSQTNIDGMSGAGKDLGAGLVSGIEAKESAVYWAAYALGQKAVQGEKDGQESNSPSKLTIKAGKWLGEGLVIGIRRMSTAVYNSGKSIGEVATNSISKSIQNISELISTDIDAQPTIRPVIDLSNVEAGASSINSMFGINPSMALMSNIGSINSMMNDRQNGSNDDVISAIEKLGNKLGKTSGDTYHVDGITYDDGSNISTAVKDIVHAVKMERRR